MELLNFYPLIDMTRNAFIEENGEKPTKLLARPDVIRALEAYAPRTVDNSRVTIFEYNGMIVEEYGGPWPFVLESDSVKREPEMKKNTKDNRMDRPLENRKELERPQIEMMFVQKGDRFEHFDRMGNQWTVEERHIDGKLGWHLFFFPAEDRTYATKSWPCKSQEAAVDFAHRKVMNSNLRRTVRNVALGDSMSLDEFDQLIRSLDRDLERFEDRYLDQ